MISHLKGRCSAARTSAYFPLDMISLLKPIFSYNLPRLNFPASNTLNTLTSTPYSSLKFIIQQFRLRLSSLRMYYMSSEISVKIKWKEFLVCSNIGPLFTIRCEVHCFMPRDIFNHVHGFLGYEAWEF